MPPTRPTPTAWTLVIVALPALAALLSYADMVAGIVRDDPAAAIAKDGAGGLLFTLVIVAIAGRAPEHEWPARLYRTTLTLGLAAGLGCYIWLAFLAG